MRGEEAIQDIQAEFPDEFADAIVDGEEVEDISEIDPVLESVKIPITESVRDISRERKVFMTEPEVDPEFRDIGEYLTSHTYPQSLSREEKVVF